MLGGLCRSGERRDQSGQFPPLRSRLAVLGAQDVDRDMVGSRVEVGLDARPDVVGRTPGDDRVDEPVTTTRHDISVGETDSAQVLLIGR